VILRRVSIDPVTPVTSTVSARTRSEPYSSIEPAIPAPPEPGPASHPADRLDRRGWRHRHPPAVKGGAGIGIDRLPLRRVNQTAPKLDTCHLRTDGRGKLGRARVTRPRLGFSSVEVSEKSIRQAGFAQIAKRTLSKAACVTVLSAKSVTSASEKVIVADPSSATARMPRVTASDQRGVGVPRPTVQIAWPGASPPPGRLPEWCLRARSVSAEQAVEALAPASTTKRSVKGVITGRGAEIAASRRTSAGCACSARSRNGAFRRGCRQWRSPAPRPLTEIFDRFSSASASKTKAQRGPQCSTGRASWRFAGYSSAGTLRR
jgi:hypothetical protein